MKLLKKIAVNMHSRVEAMADCLENKEALSTAYIREYERLVAKAKVRSAQMEGEAAQLEKEALRLKEQITLWAERARQVHSSDESKALMCVARMTQAQSDLRQVQSELEEARRQKQKMAQDVDHILKKLTLVKRKHRDLAGRQSCAEAVHALQHADGGIQDDIEDLLTRWETDVVAQELCVQAPAASSDPLTEEFETAEQTQALKTALAQIIGNPEQEKEE